MWLQDVNIGATLALNTCLFDNEMLPPLPRLDSDLMKNTYVYVVRKILDDLCRLISRRGYYKIKVKIPVVLDSLPSQRH